MHGNKYIQYFYMLYINIWRYQVVFIYLTTFDVIKVLLKLQNNLAPS